MALLCSSYIAQADNDLIQAPQDRVPGEEIERLKQTNEIYEKVIKNLIQRIERLEEISVDSPVDEIGASEKELAPEVKARLKKESEENYQLIEAAFEQRLNKEGGMLLPQNQLIYELGFSYAHSSYDKIVVDGFTVYPVLIIGDIVDEKVRRDIVTNTHSFRLGLGGNMQLDLMVPIGYEKEHAFRDDGTHETKQANGYGDISLGLSRQLIKTHARWPDTVLGLNWKTASGGDPYSKDLALGTGFYTLGLSITSMTSADPMVLFGGLSTSYTPSRTKNIGDVKPGNTYGLSLGMALALNFDTSLSFNYQLQFTEKTILEGREISGSDTTTSTFAIGFSRARGQSFAFDIDLGIGLTRDSPDFQLSISFPFEYTAHMPEVSE